MLAWHLDGANDISSRNVQFIGRSIEWIASRFGVGTGTRVADFGCGPGWYSNGLARFGAHVTGIDFSPRSIEYAREIAAREQLNADYVRQDYLDFETRMRFDLVLMIMCDFCALSPDQRRRMLRKFHRILRSGGSLLLDVYSMVEFDRIKEASTFAVNMFDGFWSPNKYFCFKNIFKYAKERVVLEKYTIVESGRTRTVYNWFQYFAPEELEREFLESGFSIPEFLSDVSGTPYDANSREFAAIAMRRDDSG